MKSFKLFDNVLVKNCGDNVIPGKIVGTCQQVSEVDNSLNLGFLVELKQGIKTGPCYISVIVVHPDNLEKVKSAFTASWE